MQRVLVSVKTKLNALVDLIKVISKKKKKLFN